MRFDDFEVGHTFTMTRAVGAAEVDAFGHLSGDLNPLHMDEAFARTTPFGRRVAHGLLIGAFISTAHTRMTGPGFVYVGQNLRFLGPVFVGDTISVDLTITDKSPAKRLLIIETTVRKQSGEAVLRGSSALKELTLA